MTQSITSSRIARIVGVRYRPAGEDRRMSWWYLQMAASLVVASYVLCRAVGHHSSFVAVKEIAAMGYLAFCVGAVFRSRWRQSRAQRSLNRHRHYVYPAGQAPTPAIGANGAITDEGFRLLDQYLALTAVPAKAAPAPAPAEPADWVPSFQPAARPVDLHK